MCEKNIKGNDKFASDTHIQQYNLRIQFFILSEKLAMK